jgi:hypothetical protein
MRASRIMKLLVVLTGFAPLATPHCYGQSEVDPDHFDSPNTERFPQPKTKGGDGAARVEVRFDGKVTLPYSLICAGKKLLPGRYSVSLRSDGKTGQALLNQKGQTLEVAGDVRLPADSNARNILLVECLGKAHRLSAIHLKEMELVFDSGPHVEHASEGKPGRTEKLPITQTTPLK